MPIIVHFGNPRQGKSYSAIADHIVPALAKGRRVVTNIEGMGSEDRKEKMRAVLKDKFNYSGEIDFHFVKHSDLERDTIFPLDTRKEDEDGTRIFDDSQSVVKFGTLIVWDEGRLFTTDQLPKAWHEALTYHGHWARGGHTVDIVIIHQNWKSLAPLVRATAEKVFEFVKNASGKGYRRFSYSSPGDRDLYRKSDETLAEDFSYDKAIFELYKTNSDDGPTNDNIGVPFWKTQYFRSKARLIALLLLVGVGGLWFAISRLMDQFGAEEPPSELVSSPAAPAIASSPFRVVGRIPTAQGEGALVQDGERYVLVPVADGKIEYRGVQLSWPDGF
jgi:zona occludens toxin